MGDGLVVRRSGHEHAKSASNHVRKQHSKKPQEPHNNTSQGSETGPVPLITAPAFGCVAVQAFAKSAKSYSGAPRNASSPNPALGVPTETTPAPF